MENSHPLSLHQCHVHKLRATFNITYALLHLLALAAIFYYRGSFFFTQTDKNHHKITLLPWLIIFIAEIFMSFIWFLHQPFYWWPVTRTVFPERLPKDEKLPGIDVFICTADPNKEPTFEVMNTVISAMTLDYPAEKLSVYLSDDGGAFVTLKGLQEAWVFSTWWLPFCRKYNIKTVCPWAYFQDPDEESQSLEFTQDRNIVKEKYEIFKDRVQSLTAKGDAKTNAQDHPALVQVINGNSTEDAQTVNPEHVEIMPLLIYVAREKKPSHPHNFKAGALNVLLRISSTFSNAPYVLVLDCDMYCNDPISARQAMCFYLDPKESPSIGWVQYPQKYYNISESDIYDSQMRILWPVYWPGSDGLQGPVISGTNLYIKRKALYGINVNNGNDLKEMRDCYGPSNEFLKSLSYNDKLHGNKGREISSILLQEAHFLASCNYEKGTKWGNKVGYRYDSVVEDVMTSFYLQSKGWRSVYLNPKRAQFLGSATTNLHETLVQGSRWVTGLIDIGLSEYSPFFPTSSKMQFLQKLSSSWLAFFPLDFFPLSCFAIIPPLSLLFGIPLYPKVSDPFFVAFAFVFISSRLKLLYDDVILSGGSINSWLNQQRMYMIKGLTCYTYGTLDSLMAKLGLREASFIPTNKTGDDDTTKWYKMGKFDFRTSHMFLVPLVTSIVLNLTCFGGGFVRAFFVGNLDVMFAQLVFSCYVLIVGLPFIEGVLFRRDNARVPLSATCISTVFSLVLLSLGYLLFSL